MTALQPLGLFRIVIVLPSPRATLNCASDRTGSNTRVLALGNDGVSKYSACTRMLDLMCWLAFRSLVFAVYFATALCGFCCRHSSATALTARVVGSTTGTYRSVCLLLLLAAVAMGNTRFPWNTTTSATFSQFLTYCTMLYLQSYPCAYEGGCDHIYSNQMWELDKSGNFRRSAAVLQHTAVPSFRTLTIVVVGNRLPSRRPEVHQWLHFM